MRELAAQVEAALRADYFIKDCVLSFEGKEGTLRLLVGAIVRPNYDVVVNSFGSDPDPGVVALQTFNNALRAIDGGRGYQAWTYGLLPSLFDGGWYLVYCIYGYVGDMYPPDTPEKLELFEDDYIGVLGVFIERYG